MSQLSNFQELATLLNQDTIAGALTLLRDEGFSAAKIAEKMEISSSCVQVYAKRYGVNFEKRRLPIDQIVELRNKGKSWQQIADVIGSHKTTVINAYKARSCTP